MRDDAPVVRTILSVNEADQSMTFAGDVPEGGYVRLMKANFDRLIDGAVGAGRVSTQALANARRSWRCSSAASGAGWCSGSASRKKWKACARSLASAPC